MVLADAGLVLVGWVPAFEFIDMKAGDIRPDPRVCGNWRVPQIAFGTTHWEKAWYVIGTDIKCTLGGVPSHGVVFNPSRTKPRSS